MFRFVLNCLGYICYVCLIIGSVFFYNKNCFRLNNKLYGYFIDRFILEKG